MNIVSTQQYSLATVSAQPQPVLEKQETENRSKVFSSVDEAEHADAPQNEHFHGRHPSEAAGSSSSGDQDKSGDSDAAVAKSADKLASAPDAEKQAKNQLEQKQLELEQAEIQKLKSRDLEVRQHEAAHAAVGGGHAGAPSFEYATGPDGKRYAVGGEVQISTSKVPNDPVRTLEKAERIRAAALAPAEPSAQDRRVAAMAAQMAIEARAEIQEMKRAELEQANKSVEEQEDKAELEEESDESTLDEETKIGFSEEEKEKYDPFAEENKPEVKLPDSVELSKHLTFLGTIEAEPTAGNLLNVSA